MAVLELDRSIAFIDVTMNVLEEKQDITDALAVLLEAERIYQVSFCSRLEEPLPKEIAIDSYSNLVEPRMSAFLSATHLVFGSYEYSKIDILFPEGIYYWSLREWGYTISKWANETKWLGSKDWSYLDFYGGLNNGVIDKYNEWSEIVLKVIELKCKNS